MKKYIISLTLVCLFVSSVFAQVQPRYIANPALDKFIGTWEASNGNFQITFIKEKRDFKFGISGDILFGLYTYKKGDVRLDSKKSDKRAIDYGSNNSDNRNKLAFNFIDVKTDKQGHATLELLPGTDNQATLLIYPKEVVTVGRGKNSHKLFFVPTKLVIKKMS